MEKEIEENKLGRLDILAILDDKTIVNIEVQVLNQYNIIERTMFYWSGNYYNHLKAGNNYKKAKKTISINILNYNEFENGPFHEIARLRRDFGNKIVTDKLEIHFIQIPKFLAEKRETKTKLEQWMQFISQTNTKEVEKAMSENKEIKKAEEQYKILTGDEYERRLAFLRDKAIRDENNAIEGAMEEGFEKGKEEGKKEGKEEGKKEGKKEGKMEGSQEEKIKIAKKLLALGIDLEDIKKATELSKEEIQKLKY